MNIARYDPWQMMDEWRRDMDRPLTSRDRDDISHVVGGDWVPAVDIKEKDDRYVLHADIPGVAPEDIEVTMENGVLSIRGERKFEKTEEKENYKRVERARGVSIAVLHSRDHTDLEGIKATGDNGVLEVIIPKTPITSPKRIEVNH